MGHRRRRRRRIQGFATDISVNVGQPDRLQDRHRRARATRSRSTALGYYGGDGARKIATVTPSAIAAADTSRSASPTSRTELYDCGNWAVSASWNVPSHRGLGRLHRPAAPRRHRRRRATSPSSSATTPATPTSSSRPPTPTWQAYNTYGGSDFYQGARQRPRLQAQLQPPGRDPRRHRRPRLLLRQRVPDGPVPGANGYDVSYIAGVDTDRRGALLTNHKTFLSVGHDEYWSGPQRANVEAARDAGVNLQFLSGNEVYWRTRYEPSADASHTAYRTLVSYKETWANAKIDPSTEWTGTWRDPRFAPAGQGRRHARRTP